MKPLSALCNFLSYYPCFAVRIPELFQLAYNELAFTPGHVQITLQELKWKFACFWRFLFVFCKATVLFVAYCITPRSFGSILSVHRNAVVFRDVFSGACTHLLPQCNRLNGQGLLFCSIVCADLGVRTVSEPLRLCGFKRGDDILLICVWKIPAILETVFNENTIQNLCHVVCHVERHTQANFDILHMSYCRNKPSTDVYYFIVDVLSRFYITQLFDVFCTPLEQNKYVELSVLVHRKVIFFCRFGEQNNCQSLISVDKTHLWWCWELYLLNRIPSGLLKKLHITTAYIDS